MPRVVIGGVNLDVDVEIVELAALSPQERAAILLSWQEDGASISFSMKGKYVGTETVTVETAEIIAPSSNGPISG